MIWNKLPECILENFEFAQAKRGQFQNFRKSLGKSLEPNMLPVNHITNKHFVLKLISFNSGQLQISERQLQNKSVNDAMLIPMYLVTI